MRALFAAKDKAGSLLRDTLAPTLVYTASVTPSIAYSADDVDRVMRWGFGWELGPFELIDAIGADNVVEAARQVDPALVGQAAASLQVLKTRRTGDVPPAAADLQILRTAKERSGVVKKNAGASLVDLGDGVLCVEFHSKMNAIGGDTIQMLQAGVREASRNFAALVVGNDAPNFSAGANLMLVLLEAQEENWDEIEVMIRAFQQTMMALRYADVPVVVAPAGLALGGGCEIVLHGDRVQAAAEIVHRSRRSRRRTDSRGRRHKGNDGPGRRRHGAWRPPTSCRRSSARSRRSRSPRCRPAHRTLNGWAICVPIDAFTMNRERLLSDAKARALQRVAEGYHPPVPRTAIRVGGDAVLAPLKLGIHLAWRAGRISDHDARDRPQAGDGHGRRQPAASVDGQRAGAAGSRARSVSQPARRAEDARADSAHVEDREAAQKLVGS